MFTELRKEFLKDRESQRKQNAFFIKHGYLSNWNEENKNENDNGLRRYSTNRRWEQYQNGEIDRAKAVELATKRMSKEIDKEITKKLAHIEAVENAPELDFCSVNVEYRRSSVWGYNPSVEAWTNGERDIFTGYASGCGYDKESAAVADAFNKSLSILKVLYTIKENGLKAGKSSKSKTACTGHDNRDICGYGAGYSVLPYFEGGVGVSCFWNILKKSGYDTTCNYGKRENFYRISKIA